MVQQFSNARYPVAEWNLASVILERFEKQSQLQKFDAMLTDKSLATLRPLPAIFRMLARNSLRNFGKPKEKARENGSE
ncbi:hypothetical protein VTI28DRAFT_2837 [Corynascus sepedonium]